MFAIIFDFSNSESTKDIKNNRNSYSLSSTFVLFYKFIKEEIKVKRLAIMSLIIIIFSFGLIINNYYQYRKSIVIDSESLVSYNGELSIDKGIIVNEKKEIVKLKGISSHNLYWYNRIYTKENIKEIRNTWGINTFRIALYTNPEEDGYSVVKDFSTFNQRGYDQTMKYLKRNDYLHDMYVKHRNHPSIWMFLEVATLGVLSRFVDFYYHRSRNKDVKLAHILLKYAKHIRNASAHNNAIMVNLFSAEEKVKHRNTTVVMFATKMGIDASLVTDMKVNDLVSLYSLHRRFSSVGSQELTRKEGQKLLKRASKHANYYTHEPVLIKFYQLFSKLINS